MKKAICGIDCNHCDYRKISGCKGCVESKGCPFGKKCFIAAYIEKGGEENYRAFKEQLIEEFNSLSIPGMPKIKELYALNGGYVNLAYPVPGGNTVKLLDDNEIYLGNQVECEFSDDSRDMCFGLVAGMGFLLVCQYGENGADPEIILYKKR